MASFYYYYYYCFEYMSIQLLLGNVQKNLTVRNKPHRLILAHFVATAYALSFGDFILFFSFMLRLFVSICFSFVFVIVLFIDVFFIIFLFIFHNISRFFIIQIIFSIQCIFRYNPLQLKLVLTTNFYQQKTTNATHVYKSLFLACLLETFLMEISTLALIIYFGILRFSQFESLSSLFNIFFTYLNYCC